MQPELAKRASDDELEPLAHQPRAGVRRERVVAEAAGLLGSSARCR